MLLCEQSRQIVEQMLGAGCDGKLVVEVADMPGAVIDREFAGREAVVERAAEDRHQQLTGSRLPVDVEPTCVRRIDTMTQDVE